MSFSDLALHPALQRAIREMGFEKPTPIQEKAIPIALEGSDLVGCAQTGTGKTAAFLLPILDRLLKRPSGGTRVLILTPTRELAVQIDEQVEQLGRHSDVTHIAVLGGMSMGSQVRALRNGVEIVVATPGRLLDHVRQGNCGFGQIEVLVLDEADRMMDMGFLPDVKRIIERLPTDRQTLMFSATMPDAIRRLADEILVNPRSVEVGKSRPPTTIRHCLFPTPAHLKSRLLLKLLEETAPESAIIFARTKRGADRLARTLAGEGHEVGCLHGDRSQSQRTAALDRFRKGRSKLLVATDIMARGIDVDGISHVINYDLPMTPDDYIHRIGRTGRAQAEGEAFSLVTQEEESRIREIERALGAQLPRARVPNFDYHSAPPPRPAGEGRPQRGRFGQRPSGQRPPRRQAEPQDGPRYVRHEVTPPMDAPRADAAPRAAKPARSEGSPRHANHDAPRHVKPAHADGAPRHVKPAHADGAPRHVKPAHADGAPRRAEPAAGSAAKSERPRSAGSNASSGAGRFDGPPRSGSGRSRPGAKYRNRHR